MRDTAAAGVGPVLSCAYNEDSDHPAHLLTALNVHVHNGGGGRTRASACVTFWNGNGGECSVTDLTPTSHGEFTLNPPRTVWTAANYPQFKYVMVILGGNGSAVRGIFAQQ
jgi:hypothetical protein